MWVNTRCKYLKRLLKVQVFKKIFIFLLKDSLDNKSTPKSEFQILNFNKIF